MVFDPWLYALGFFAILVVTQEIFHRYPRFSMWFFIIVSIILFPCWILLFGVNDWFAWLKVLSIAMGIIVLSVFRNTSLGKTAWFPWVIYGFLVVNILEAVVRDTVGGNLANYLNAAAGVLLIATLTDIKSISIAKKTSSNDLCWESMTFAWIIGYTIWNWLFVYLNFGVQSSIQHVAVLGAALLTAFIDQKRWLQARVFTLGTYFILVHSFPHLNQALSVSDTNASLGLILGFFSFGFMLIYTIRFLLQKPVLKKGKSA